MKKYLLLSALLAAVAGASPAQADTCYAPVFIAYYLPPNSSGGHPVQIDYGASFTIGYSDETPSSLRKKALSAVRGNLCHENREHCSNFIVSGYLFPASVNVTCMAVTDSLTHTP